MRQILVELNSKALFVLALALALVLFVRDAWKRRRDPSWGWSSNPLWLVAAALALVKLRGGDFALDVFAHDWKPVPIYAYGVMLGTAMIVGWFVAMRFSRQDGIPLEIAGTLYMYGAVWSIIGARLLYVLVWWRSFDSLVDVFMIQRGGLVAYGGMIGGFIATCYCCWRRRVPLLQWADVAAPSVVLGTGITRIGCFLYGCDFGRITDVPWAVRFPPGSAAFRQHIEHNGLSADALGSFPVHPTQLYEMVVGFGLFGLLVFLRKHRRFSGQVFLGWVIGYGIMRPLIEILRDDDQRGTIAGLSTSQFIGIGACLVGIVLLIKLIRQYRAAPDSLRLWEHPIPFAAGAAGGVAAAPESGGGTASRPAGRRKRRR